MAMATERDVINDYLDRLDRAAQVLPPDRRIELLAEIREHIAEATAVEGDGGAATRALLDRLGPPAEIVAAAAEGGEPWRGPALPRRHRSRALEIWAVVMLTAGSVILPVIGWLVGVALMWSSDRWRTREKLLGTLVVPGGLGAVILAFGLGMTTSSCFESTTTAPDASGRPVTTTTGDCGGSSWTQWLGIAGAITVVLAALIVPFILLHLARKRADAELSQPQPTPWG
jgi:uncharacterized membrane protein